MHSTVRFTACLALALISTPALANPASPMHCNFDGDLYDDLAIGSPGEAVGTEASAGAVNVIYGYAVDGLTSWADQIFHEDSTGFSGSPKAGDSFGAAIACGDFDSDGYDDLVIGVPHEEVDGKPMAGGVYVIAGGPFGLDDTKVTLWTEANTGVGATGVGDRFGSALAVGDFDNNGYEDLAIGIPGEKIGSADNSGAVTVLEGSYFGLTTFDAVHFDNNTAAQPNVQIRGDAFGSALAVGYFDDDLYADLAIGVPLKDLPCPTPEKPDLVCSSTGAVVVMYGDAADTLDLSSPQQWDQNQPGVQSAGEQQDLFGTSLAAGDFDGDGQDDLAVGVPGEDGFSGAAHVFYADASGLTSDDQIWRQGDVQGAPEASDRFGHSLVAGDFDNDGNSDLAVGVPGEDVGTVVAAGAVNVILGSAAGLTDIGDQIFYQGAYDMLDTPAEGEQFAYTLSVGDFDEDGRDDLAIGVPGQAQNGLRASGLAQVMYGADHGLTSVGNQVWHQASPNIEGVLEAHDRMGGDVVSQGVYRVPYADGTSVSVGHDTWQHWPGLQIDMGGVGARSYTIVAAATGTVARFDDSNTQHGEGNNNYLWLKHPNGEYTKYSHMTNGFGAGFVVGTTEIQAGEVIGTEDDIGNASKDHLHFEVSVPDDPEFPFGGDANAEDVEGRNVIPQFCIPGGWMVSGAVVTAQDC